MTGSSPAFAGEAVKVWRFQEYGTQSVRTEQLWQEVPFKETPSNSGATFAFARLWLGPFEAPAIVKPPALPEETYFMTPSIHHQ
jgi:hypothetical protein